MKLYAVTQGEYSDYHIIALTTSKEKANIIAKAKSDKYESAMVEEYEENDFSTKDDVCSVYCVEIEIKEGSFYIKEIYETYGSHHSLYYFDDEEKVFRVYVKTDSEEKAKKIAEDNFTFYLASKNNLT